MQRERARVQRLISGVAWAEDLRLELWGTFLTVSGTRNGAAMGQRRPSARLMGAGLVLRRELNHGFFSATWKLPVSFPLNAHAQPVVHNVLAV